MPKQKNKSVDLSDLDQAVPVKNAAGYFITPDGKLFCVRQMKAWIDPDKYARATIIVSEKRKGVAIHRLMAEAFLEKKSNGQNEVRHLDGDPTNNKLENLAWGTRQQNAQDMADHGTVKGERNGRAILTEEEVRDMKDLLDDGELTYAEIAKRFGVSKGTVSAIREGRNWSHVA